MQLNGKSTKKVQPEVKDLGLFGLKISQMPLSDGSALDPLGDELGLSAADQRRLSEIQSPIKLQHFLSARRALQAIDPVLVAQLRYRDRRPELPGGFVSLSHGGSHAVAAFHPSLAVGIDVEGPRDQLVRIAKKFLHPEEQDFIRQQSGPWALRVAWGAKEAIFKAAQQPGLDFSEGIRLLSWPKNLHPAGDFAGSLGVFEAQIRSGRRFRLGAEVLAAANGLTDCLVWAIEIPRSFEIVLTGAESSGKTSLGERMHASQGWAFVPEFAREYFGDRGGDRGDKNYNLNDVQAIHLGQRQRIHEAQERLQSISSRLVPLLLCDTDDMTTHLWAEEKFGALPSKMQTTPSAHAYLLCGDEIAWEADPLRENPKDRTRLMAIIQKKIESLKRPYILLRGSLEERETQALDFLRSQRFE